MPQSITYIASAVMPPFPATCISQIGWDTKDQNPLYRLITSGERYFLKLNYDVQQCTITEFVLNKHDWFLYHEWA